MREYASPQIFLPLLSLNNYVTLSRIKRAVRSLFWNEENNWKKDISSTLSALTHSNLERTFGNLYMILLFQSLKQPSRHWSSPLSQSPCIIKPTDHESGSDVCKNSDQIVIFVVYLSVPSKAFEDMLNRSRTSTKCPVTGPLIWSFNSLPHWFVLSTPRVPSLESAKVNLNPRYPTQDTNSRCQPS